MAKPPFEWKVRDELDAYMPEEIFLSEVRAKIGLEIYTKLVEQVRKDMLESAMVSIEWMLTDRAPVIDVSFMHLESLRFELEPVLKEMPDLIESIHARDTLAALFERTAKNLRDIEDEYFEEFYNEETGRSGTDPPPE